MTEDDDFEGRAPWWHFGAHLDDTAALVIAYILLMTIFSFQAMTQ